MCNGVQRSVCWIVLQRNTMQEAAARAAIAPPIHLSPAKTSACMHLIWNKISTYTYIYSFPFASFQDDPENWEAVLRRLGVSTLASMHAGVRAPMTLPVAACWSQVEDHVIAEMSQEKMFKLWQHVDFNLDDRWLNHLLEGSKPCVGDAWFGKVHPSSGWGFTDCLQRQTW